MIVALARRLIRTYAALREDRRGVALIEFAMVVPFMVLLYAGGFQLMDAISAYRKVTTTVSALADLTTQSTTLTTTQADEILNASRQLMLPYSVSAATLRITQIEIQANNQPRVSWSRSLNGTALTAGTPITIPTNVSPAGTWLIFAEVQYSYASPIPTSLVGQIVFSDRIYMAPRGSPSIPLT